MTSDSGHKDRLSQSHPNKWPIVRLSEVVDILTGFPFKGESYSKSGIRVVRGENISEGFLRWDSDKRWRFPIAELDSYLLKESDVVIGMDGSKVGHNKCMIDREDLPLIFAQRVARLRSKESLDQTYLYYNILSNRFLRYVESIKTGTSIPHVSSRQILNFEIPLPTVEEQREIAHLFSSLDSKIKLNQKMNETLESIAQAIFKHWFIDFEFPNEEGKPYKSSGGEMVDSELGKIPKGWEITTVGKCVSVNGGTTPRTSELHYWINGTKFWATPKDLSNLSSPVLINTERKITVDGLTSIGDRLFPKGSLLLSSRAPIGYLALTGIETSVNQGIIAILPNGKLSPFYMYGWCRANMNLIKDNANGSTFAEISKSSFRSIKIILPEKGLLQLYDEIFSKVYTKMTNSAKQSLVLFNIRDTLLPRLMSGKIRVPLEE